MSKGFITCLVLIVLAIVWFAAWPALQPEPCGPNYGTSCTPYLDSELHPTGK